MNETYSTPSQDTVNVLRGQLPADLNTSTLYALATLVDARGAEIDTLHPAARHAVDTRGGVTVVWLVTSDSFAAGYGDMDNRTWTVGIYAALETAVADIWRKIIADDGIFNPIFTEQAVITTLVPNPTGPTWTPADDEGAHARPPAGWASTDDTGV